MRAGEDPTMVAARMTRLLADERSAAITRRGLDYLDTLFGARAGLGTEMAVAALAGALEENTVRVLAPTYTRALIAAAR